MPSLAELRKQKLKEQEESQTIQESKEKDTETISKPVELVQLHPPKKLTKQIPKSDTPQEIYDIDFNKICINLAQDLDYQRSVMKAFRNALPQIFGGIKTRVSKEEMSKEFNERVKTHFDLTTPLLNEMRKESDLFKKQQSKHNS